MSEAQTPNIFPVSYWSRVAAEFKRQVYQVKAPIGHKPEDLTSPAYWSKVRADLKAGDIIEVIAEDESFFVSLRVMSIGKDLTAGKVFVRQIPFIDDAKVQAVEIAEAKDLPELPDGYSLKRGRFGRFRVTWNGEIIKEEIPSELEAVHFAVEHSKAT